MRRLLSVAVLAGMSCLSLAQSVDDVRSTLSQQRQLLTSAAANLEISNQLTSAFYKSHGQPVGDTSSQQASCKWQFSGDKWRFAESAEQATVYDGQNYYHLFFDEGPDKPSGVTKMAKPAVPLTPLSFGYQLQGQWWDDVLKDGNGFTVVASREATDQFGPLVHLRGTTAQNQTCELWFSPREKMVVRATLENPDENQVEGWRVTALNTDGPAPLPTQGEHELFSTSTGDLLMKETETAHDISLAAQPDSAFTFTLANNGVLKDDTQHKLSQLQNGNLVFIKKTKPTSPGQVPGLAWITSATLLGSLGVFAVLRRRRP